MGPRDDDRRGFNYAKLNGSNYRDWAWYTTELYLLDQGRFEYADGSLERPSDDNRADWIKMDRKALAAF